MNRRNENEIHSAKEAAAKTDSCTFSGFPGGNGSFRIDENGKASDMAPSTIMSGDGCNPVSRDDEMAWAHSGEGVSFPGSILPGSSLSNGILPDSSLPGAASDPLPPAYFPGSFPGTFPGTFPGAGPFEP